MTEKEKQSVLFARLEQLAELDQFELLPGDWEQDGRVKSIRLIYLMNDTAESFLVFENAKLTGEYIVDFEGTIELSLSDREQDYLLVVHQGGDHAFTICFEKLSMENHFYNYGRTAHFWVSGYEYLRQIEYRAAVLRDKYDYLGSDAVSETEKRLAALTEFPPLNACCYPAVSKEYLVMRDDSWSLSEEALKLMLETAARCGDRSLIRSLKRYGRFPCRLFAKRIACLLHRKRHIQTVRGLMDMFENAAAVYPDRSFGETEDRRYNEAYRRAKQAAEKLKTEGREAVILREEPFVYASDGIGMKLYLMIWKAGLLNMKTEVKLMEEL